MSHPEKQPSILIVEDDPLFAALVATRLRIEGMQSIECPGGREALEMVGRRPLDLVILDVMMPEVDGYQVLQHIRSTAETARLPVIMLSASTEPADVEKGLALGANYYVTKPFNAAELVRKVRLCLEEGKASRSATRGGDAHDN